MDRRDLDRLSRQNEALRAIERDLDNVVSDLAALSMVSSQDGNVGVERDEETREMIHGQLTGASDALHLWVGALEEEIDWQTHNQ